MSLGASNKIGMVIALIRQHFGFWLAISLALPFLYYSALVLAPMIKFQQWPNYINVYDWFGNVLRIVESTPSVRDQLVIIKDEWVLELGYMNYDFGIGISQWSLFIAPIKVLGVVAMSSLIATWLVLRKGNRSCARGSRWLSNASGGLGGACIALASVSLSWVVCCSTPTWVVGLAMMGMGVSTALWLEPLGAWVGLLGFILLLAALGFAIAQLPNHQRGPQHV